MDCFLRCLDWAIGAFLIALVAAMLAIGTLQVFFRYVLQSSLSWSEEVMRFLYVWITVIGIALGIRSKGMAAITTLTDWLGAKSPASKHALMLLGFAIQAALFVILVVCGWQFAAGSAKQLAPATRVSMQLVYLAMPVGGAVCLLYTVDEVRNYVVGRMTARTPPDQRTEG